MPTEIIIQCNTLDENDDAKYTVPTSQVIETIYTHFDGKFPNNARVYKNEVAEAFDITPYDEASILALNETEGTIYVVVYPQFFLFGLAGIFGTLLKIVLLGLLSYLLRPKPPKERNRGDQSPNNGLSDRTNSARPKERIPDIYGTVNSVPDLIMPTWYRFEANRQIEYSYMCIGRGQYHVEDIKDDTTPIEDIPAVSVEVYGPNESPNKPNAVLQEQIGNRINQRVWGVEKSNSVNGQILRPPDATNIDGSENIAFNFGGQITTSQSGDTFAFDDYYATGDTLTISNSVSGGNTINLDGTYEVHSVTASQVTLVRPELVNSNWSSNGNFNTPFTDANLTSPNDKWVGPFIIERPWVILANYTAPQGVYKDDGEDQMWHVVQIETEMWEIDANGDQIGPIERTQRYIEGSRELTNERSESSFHYVSAGTVVQSKKRRWKVRARRVTPKGDETDIRFAEQVQWDSLYSLEYITEEHFGDVTTIMTRTPATSGALSVSERKLNCKVTREIIGRHELSVTPENPWGFTPDNVQVTSAGLIIRDIALDPKLGNMQENELDYQSIFTAIAISQQYFGTLDCRNIGITFDERDTSAEEMIQQIARAIFCVAYRQGDKLKLHFEKKTALASLIFNHRNKVPKSEVRTIKFGNNDDHDGVQIEWINPKDGATETYFAPDNLANNPRTIEMLGVTNEVLAHMHAWREWGKIQHRNVAVEFEATAEAATLTQNERVLVADNTRGDTIDGEVTYQNGVEIGLSQPFVKEAGKEYVIYFQLYDGSVEMLDVLLTIGDKAITVGSAPRLPLVTQDSKYAKTTFIIAESTQVRPTAFLTQEMEPEDGYRVRVSAYNYDDRFYERDKDFINGFFDADSSTKIILAEDFESFNVPPGQWGHFQDPGIFTSNNPIEIQNNVAGPPAEGSKHCELDGLNRIWVDVMTTVGWSYDLMLYYSPRAGVSAADNTIEIWWDGSLFHTLADESSTVNWRPIFFNLPAPTTSSTRLEFRSIQGTGLGGYLDDIRVRETTS